MYSVVINMIADYYAGILDFKDGIWNTFIKKGASRFYNL